MQRGKPTGQVGSFSLETTPQSKLLREAGGKFQEWRAPFASYIAVAQIAGEINSTCDPTDLAEFLVHSTLEKAHRALAQSSYPKLLFAGNPGALISPAFAESFATGLTNCEVVQLSSGIHYLQEDHPEVIGAAVNEWLTDLGVGSSPKHKVAV